MKKIGLVFTIFFILFSNNAISKEVKISNKHKREAVPKKAIVDSSSIIPFDINTEKLPPAYKGNDISKLYSDFTKRAPIEKEEFETTADYPLCQYS